MSRKVDKELNEKRAKRLRECRKDSEMSLQKLADKMPWECSPQIISQLEHGARYVTYEKIKDLAKILGVNPYYILCESDIKHLPAPGEELTVIGSENTADKLFLLFLASQGHDVKFHVCLLKNIRHSTFEYTIGIDRLYKFSFNDNSCIVYGDSNLESDPDPWTHNTESDTEEERNKKYECIISSVSIDGATIDYPDFVFFIHRIYSHIESGIEGIQSLSADLEQYHNNKTRTPIPAMPD